MFSFRTLARWAVSASLMALCASAAFADTVTTADGTVLTTSTVAQPSGARLSMQIDAVADIDRVQKIYIALVLPSGLVLFRGTQGWQAWSGGAIPTLYTQAQTQCRQGHSFVFSLEFPGLPDLSQLKSMGLGGATFYAGFGIDEADMVLGRKFAPIYTVPR